MLNLASWRSPIAGPPLLCSSVSVERQGKQAPSQSERWGGAIFSLSFEMWNSPSRHVRCRGGIFFLTRAAPIHPKESARNNAAPTTRVQPVTIAAAAQAWRSLFGGINAWWITGACLPAAGYFCCRAFSFFRKASRLSCSRKILSLSRRSVCSAATFIHHASYRAFQSLSKGELSRVNGR